MGTDVCLEDECNLSAVAKAQSWLLRLEKAAHMWQVDGGMQEDKLFSSLIKHGKQK